ncbi:MAG TPA: hypothetical protein VJ184_13800 [Chryseolinea sp.]|nr:hypothetical protein [Chryseolinea sp.]
MAKDMGADGLEVDISGLGERETFDNKLSDPLTRELFLNKAKELNLDIDFTIRFHKEFLRVTKEIVMEANLFKSA